MLDLQACMKVHIFLMRQTPVVPNHVLADPKLTHLCPAGPGRQATRRVPCARLSISIGSVDCSLWKATLEMHAAFSICVLGRQELEGGMSLGQLTTLLRFKEELASLNQTNILL